MIPMSQTDPERPEPLEYEDPAAMVRWFKMQAASAKANELYLKQLAWQTDEPEWIQAAIDASDVAVQFEADATVAEYVARILDPKDDDFPF